MNQRRNVSNIKNKTKKINNKHFISLSKPRQKMKIKGENEKKNQF